MIMGDDPGEGSQLAEPASPERVLPIHVDVPWPVGLNDEVDLPVPINAVAEVDTVGGTRVPEC
jgi:hypothetical protein